MEQTTIDLLLQHGRCCITGLPMHSSQHLNMVVLDYACTWDCPYEANFLMPEKPRRAVAIIHDDAYDSTKKYIMNGRVKFAIEIKEGKILYHPVENLQSIRYADEN